MQDVNDMYILLEEAEKNAVRNSLIEERSRFCMLVQFLKPVVVRVWSTVETYPVVGGRVVSNRSRGPSLLYSMITH